MSEKGYPSGVLTQGVRRRLAGAEPEWRRLKKQVGEITGKIPQDMDGKDHLKRQKPLMPRKVQRRLQRLRSGYRKSYQQEYKSILQAWRGLFQNRRTMLNTFQKTRSGLWVQEIASFKSTQMVLSKLAKQLMAIRKEIRE